MLHEWMNTVTEKFSGDELGDDDHVFSDLLLQELISLTKI